MLRQQLIEWNLMFRYDRQYRKKYNIAFGSTQHRDSDQIDIYLEFLEERMMKQMYQEYSDRDKELQLYKENGSLFKQRDDSQEITPQEKEIEDELFDNLDYSKLNHKPQ